MFKSLTLSAALVLSGTVAAQSAPVTLGGLDMVKQWTDNENIQDEMPDFVWGTADTDGADAIGLYYEFDDGTEGGIVLSGVASHWNSNIGGVFPGVVVESATGFFAPYAAAGLHFLYNSAATDLYPMALPIAWSNNPATAFGSNVELDYNDNGTGSESRISVAGWTSVTVSTYAGDIAPVPLPAAGLLLAGALAGLSRLRARKS